MDEKKLTGPDHTLAGSQVEGKGEEPQIYSVTDLKAFIKPNMDEELGSPGGGAAEPGTTTICACVPVGECVCNTVSYHVGGDPCPDLCSCVGNTCVGGLYWYPY